MKANKIGLAALGVVVAAFGLVGGAGVSSLASRSAGNAADKACASVLDHAKSLL